MARKRVIQATCEFEDEWYFLYARISSDDKKRQTRDGRSREAEGVESQLRRLHAECDRRGVPKDRRIEFADNDISASRFGTKEREDYARLIDHIKRSQHCTVMAVEQGRIVRQELEGVQFKELMISRRMTFAALSMDFDLTEQSGDVMWTMNLFKDRQESETISRRVRGKFKDDRGQGRMRTSRIAFGYADTEYRVIVKDQAEMLHSMRKHIMNEGTIGECVRMLETAGYVSPYPRKDGSHGPYTRQAVTHMLTNATYAGYVTHEGEIVRKADNVATIFTRAEFNALQEEMAKIQLKSISRRKAPVRIGRKYVVTGFLRCGKDGCGGGMEINHGNSLGWTCSVCHGCWRKHETVMSVVNAWVRRRLELAAVEVREEAMADPRALTLEADLAELESRRARLTAAYSNPAVPVADEEYWPIMASLRDEITTRQTALARMVRDAERALPPDALALWQDDRPETLGARRAMLATLVDSVIILPAPPPPDGKKSWGRRGAPPESVRVLARRSSVGAEPTGGMVSAVSTASTADVEHAEALAS